MDGCSPGLAIGYRGELTYRFSDPGPSDARRWRPSNEGWPIGRGHDRRASRLCELAFTIPFESSDRDGGDILASNGSRSFPKSGSDHFTLEPLGPGAFIASDGSC